LYHTTSYRFPGGPNWLDADRFDLDARAETASSEMQLRQMLQTLLAERCKLTLRRENREISVYELKVGKNGSRLTEWKEGQL
jgi:uncharacterized protein (TIGR03435 family)